MSNQESIMHLQSMVTKYDEVIDNLENALSVKKELENAITISGRIIELDISENEYGTISISGSYEDASGIQEIDGYTLYWNDINQKGRLEYFEVKTTEACAKFFPKKDLLSISGKWHLVQGSEFKSTPVIETKKTDIYVERLDFSKYNYNGYSGRSKFHISNYYYSNLVPFAQDNMQFKAVLRPDAKVMNQYFTKFNTLNTNLKQSISNIPQQDLKIIIGETSITSKVLKLNTDMIINPLQESKVESFVVKMNRYATHLSHQLDMVKHEKNNLKNLIQLKKSSTTLSSAIGSNH